jgi:parallel beta-helix repeat protein
MITIDLNGFTITGGTNAQAGIVSGSGTSGITIRNGNVLGWNVGINLASTTGVVIENVDASKCVQQGIFAGSRATIRNCTANENGDYGIYASNYSIVSGCNATRNGGGIMTAGNSNVFDCHASDSQDGCGLNIGSASTVTQCTATNNTSSGIEVGSRVTVRGCTAYGNGGTGIVTQANCTVTESTAVHQFASGGGINAGAGSSVINCNASSNGTSGIRVSANSRVIGNLCQGNGNGEWPGIHVTGTGNRIEGNSLIGNHHGMRVDSADNLIIANSARQNPGGAYSIPAGNEYGQILTSPGSSFSSTNPWANFAY